MYKVFKVVDGERIFHHGEFTTRGKAREFCRKITRVRKEGMMHILHPDGMVEYIYVNIKGSGVQNES
jgi:hypothetical protein